MSQVPQLDLSRYNSVCVAEETKLCPHDVYRCSGIQNMQLYLQVPCTSACTQAKPREHFDNVVNGDIINYDLSLY
jgi:hypothetical protein